MAENPYMLTPEEQLAYAGTDPAHPYIDPQVVTKPVEFALNPQKYGYRNLLEAGVDAAGQAAPYILYNMSPGGVPVTAARNMASDWQNPYMPNWQKVVNSAADLLGVTMMAAPTQIGRMGARAFDYIDDAVKNPYVMSPLRNEVGMVRVGGKATDEPLSQWLGGRKTITSKDIDALNADEPVVIKAYHKTNATFDKFDKSKIGKNDPGYAGHGFYLTPEPLQGLTYGDRTMPTYVRMDKPYVRTKSNWNSSDIDPYTWIPQKTQELVDGGQPWAEARATASQAWTSMMQEAGYDGFIDTAVKNGEIVAFEPDQLRSVWDY